MYVKETILPLLARYQIPYHLYAHEAIAHGDITVALPAMQGTMLTAIFTLPLDYRADLKALALAVGSPRFSFAKASDLAVMGIPPGHVSPLCLLNDLGQQFHYVQPIELDQFDLVNCHPLDNHFSIDIKRTDLEHLVQDSGHAITKVEGTVIVPD